MWQRNQSPQNPFLDPNDAPSDDEGASHPMSIDPKGYFSYPLSPLAVGTSLEPPASLSGNKRRPHRAFMFLKSNPFGIYSALGFRVRIVPAEVGGSVEGAGGGVAFHTDHMSSLKQRPYLPSPFRLYRGKEGDGSCGSGRQGRRRQEDEVARVRYQGWEGMFRLKFNVEMYGSAHPPTKFVVDRKGNGREYSVTGLTLNGHQHEYLWRGSTSVLDKVVTDGAPTCNGNLKLVNPARRRQSQEGLEDGVLAVWKNRSDTKSLGSLFILDEEIREGNGLEEVVVGCLALVLGERMSWRGLLGGMGKSAKEI